MLKQQIKGHDMLFEQKKGNFTGSEFSILPYTQNRKLENLGKHSFTSNFESQCNLWFRNNKNELRKKFKGQDVLFEEKKVSRFPNFRFCSTPKIENSEILESVLPFQILIAVVT